MTDGDRQLAISNQQSAICISNQQSAISNLRRRRRRRGLSYLEVLIAAGIALVGMLGAIAIFPVAIMNLQRGQVVDTMAVVGPSALHTGPTLGVTTKSQWLKHDDATGWVAPLFPPPVALATDNMPTVFGMWSSYCFDPRLAAENPPGAPGFDPRLFPFKPQGTNDPRMVRLTLSRGAVVPPYWQTSQARLLFKMNDDLIFDRPEDVTAPASQLWMNDGTADQRRDYMADYEYIITLTPNLRGIPVDFFGSSQILGAATPTFLNEPIPLETPTEYTMSAVVFYKRQARLDPFIPGDSREPEAERVTDVVAFHNSGYNGGDVTIQGRTPIATGGLANELQVHEGDWVLLSGNAYSLGAPRKFMGPQFHWYRVASVNGESYPGATHYQRDLTLDGPDWPVALTTQSPTNPGTQLSIISGVVGVFSTTVTVK